MSEVFHERQLDVDQTLLRGRQIINYVLLDTNIIKRTSALDLGQYNSKNLTYI